MKQVEAQINLGLVVVTNLQNQMEALEERSSKHHEAIQSLETKLDALIDGMAKRLDGFLWMFSRILQINLLGDILPKENRDPILEHNESQLKEGEQLARAIQESLNIEYPS